MGIHVALNHKTRYRYDRNENLVLVQSPMAVKGSKAQNVATALFDERDMLWKATRGGVDAQYKAIASAPSGPLGTAPEAAGLQQTGLTSTTRRFCRALSTRSS